jgi:hypothetical protein
MAADKGRLVSRQESSGVFVSAHFSLVPKLSLGTRLFATLGGGDKDPLLCKTAKLFPAGSQTQFGNQSYNRGEMARQKGEAPAEP